MVGLIRLIYEEISLIKPTYDVWEDEKGYEKVEVYESTFTMDNVEQSLRFVKFAMKHKDNKRTQIMIVTTCMDISDQSHGLLGNL